MKNRQTNLCPACLARLDDVEDPKYRKQFTVGVIDNETNHCDRCTYVGPPALPPIFVERLCPCNQDTAEMDML